MSYSVDLLKTTAECDALIAIAGKEMEDLLFRKTSLERQKVSYANSSNEIDKDIAATALEISSLQTAVAGLPAGSARNQNEARLKRLELKQFLLGQRDKNYGAISLLTREYDLELNAKDIEATNAFIASVTERKAAL